MKKQKLACIAAFTLLAATIQSGSALAKDTFEFSAKDPCKLKDIKPTFKDENYIVTITVEGSDPKFILNEDAPILFINADKKPYIPSGDIISKIKVFKNSNGQTVIKFRDFNPTAKSYPYILNYTDVDGNYACPIPFTAGSPANVDNTGQ